MAGPKQYLASLDVRGNAHIHGDLVVDGSGGGVQADGSVPFTGPVTLKGAPGDDANIWYDVDSGPGAYALRIQGVTGGGSIRLHRDGRVLLINNDGTGYIGITATGQVFISSDGLHESYFQPDGSLVLDVTGFGIFGATPVAQQAHLADPAANAAALATWAAAINDRLEAFGWQATS
jgi:hypothetical protein